MRASPHPFKQPLAAGWVPSLWSSDDLSRVKGKEDGMAPGLATEITGYPEIASPPTKTRQPMPLDFKPNRTACETDVQPRAKMRCRAPARNT